MEKKEEDFSILAPGMFLILLGMKSDEDEGYVVMKAYLGWAFKVFVWAIPTYGVYRLYDSERSVG